MNKKKLIAIHQTIYSLVNDQVLARAFVLIRKLIDDYKLNEWHLVERCNELEEQFKQMLIFNLQENVVDTGRSEFINSIKVEALQLLDDTIENILIKNSDDFDYKLIRNYLNNNTINANNDLLFNTANIQVYDAAIENSFNNIFNDIWLKPNLDGADLHLYEKCLCADNVSETVKCLIASALTLRILRKYNPQQIKFVFEIIDKITPTVKARLSVYIIIVIFKYGQRLMTDTKVWQYINQYFENEANTADAIKIIYSFIRTYKTTEIVKLINDEIYPEMIKSGMKLKDAIKNKKKNDYSNALDDDDFISLDNIADNSELSDKLKQFNDMQLNGDDVYMSTFSSMKTYPFFSDTCHWFLPFDSKKADINSLIEQGGDVLKLFSKSSQMCHSDKYSFFYSLSQMLSFGNIKDMVIQMGGEMDQLKEEMSSDNWKSLMPQQLFDIELHSYTLDLYRFYNINTEAKNLDNPFDIILQNIDNNLVIRTIFSLSELRTLCAYLFEVGLWQSCKLLSDYLDKENVWDVKFYLQLGYCSEKLNLWNDAYSAYQKADLIQPNNRLILRRKASYFKFINDFEAAIKCYSDIVKLNNDDFSTLFLLAECYVQTKQYEKAKTIFYKLDYLNPEQPKIQRALAWCLFLNKNFDDSHAIYIKLTNSKHKLNEDYINLGLTLLALGSKSEARKIFTEVKNNMADDDMFIKSLKSNANWMHTIGISDEDIAVFINQIIMSL